MTIDVYCLIPPPPKKKGNLMTLIAPTQDPFMSKYPKHSVRTGEWNWIAWQSIAQKISNMWIIRKKPGPSQDKHKVSTTTTLNTFEISIILFFVDATWKKTAKAKSLIVLGAHFDQKSPSLSLKGRDSPNSPLHGVPGVSSKPGRRWPTPTAKGPAKVLAETRLLMKGPFLDKHRLKYARNINTQK